MDIILDILKIWQNIFLVIIFIYYIYGLLFK